MIQRHNPDHIRVPLKSLTWFEESVLNLSSDDPNFRPIIGLILSDARELLLLSENNKKLYNKILKFVNEVEKAYIRNKFIDADTFLKMYFQLINLKNMFGDVNGR